MDNTPDVTPLPKQPFSIVTFVNLMIPGTYGFTTLFVMAALAFSSVFVTANSFIADIEVAALTRLSIPAAVSKVEKVAQGGVVGKSEEYILVKFKDTIGSERSAEVLESHNLSERGNIPQLGVRMIKVREGETPEQLIEELLLSEGDAIEFAEVDALIAPEYTTNDPSFGSQWHITKIQGKTAWDTARGAGIVVGIADTGVDCTHADLATNCVSGWNVISNNSDTTDIQGHGTKVSGTAAEVGDNAIGSAGVAYQAKIMPLRITNSTDGYATWSAVASAITWAADHGARVVSNSYGSTQSATVQSAANYLKSKGGLFVAAAGNEGTLLTGTNPAMVITAAATDANDVRASWSNYGPEVDVAAPGVSIYTTAKGGGYANVSGTSFATPNTAGVLALIFATNPSLTPDQARQVLFDSVDDLGTPGWDQYFGWGRINASKAVAMASSTMGLKDTTPPTTPANITAVAPDSSKVNVTWSASNDNVGVTAYDVYRDGVKVASVSGTTYVDTKIVPLTAYAYTVQAVDGAGNLSTMSTSVSVSVPEQSLALLSSGVGAKTSTTAVVNWTTNMSTTGVVKYGKSATSLTSTSPTTALGTGGTVTLSGLTRKTTYYYQVVVTTADGKTVASTIGAFTTKPK